MDLPAQQSSPRWVHVVTTPAARRVCAALTLAAGLLGTPGAASAQPASLNRAAPSSAACVSDVTVAVDAAVADRVRPLMDGRRLGRAVTGSSIACARAIVRTVQSRGLPQRAAVIAVTTAIAESTLHNRTVATDHDSLGLFQQRPSMGWGRPEQLIDPAYATGKFLDAMIRKYPGDRWLTGDIGRICQQVQKSSFPHAYAPEAHDAQLIVEQLWTGPAAPAATTGTATTTPATPEPTSASPAQPAGPFQRVLAATHTGLGPTDARHDLFTADWNGDRHADLVAVQGTGTTTGKTELRVMNGATSFQAVLLHTATVLGPADQPHTFTMTDWNADGRLDLVAVQTAGTAGGRVEVRVADGASGFQRLLTDRVTALPAAAGQDHFVADWNADGRPDLVAVQTAGTTRVRVADGATDLQKELPQPAVTADTAGERHDVLVADWNGDRRADLITVRRADAAGEPAQVRILDGASGLRRTLAQGSTALSATDERHDLSVADWNADGTPDLVVTQKPGDPAGRTEALVLDGTLR